MRHQAFRTIALMLGVMLAAAPAAQAGTITYGEVVRTAGAGGQLRPAIDMRLRIAAQGVATGQSGAASSQEPQASGQQQTPAPSGPTDGSTTAPSDPTLSQSGGQIQTVDLGDVTGTVCDCGEIPAGPKIPGGGFPWWTLAGIPLVCVSGICAGGDNDTPKPTTTPTTTPTVTQFTNRPNPQPTQFCINCSPVPEPTSLFLFGSGLLAVGAAVRRRYGRRREEESSLSETGEEV